MFPNLYFASLKYKIAAVSIEIYIYIWMRKQTDRYFSLNTLPHKEIVKNFA